MKRVIIHCSRRVRLSHHGQNSLISTCWYPLAFSPANRGEKTQSNAGANGVLITRKPSEYALRWELILAAVWGDAQKTSLQNRNESKMVSPQESTSLLKTFSTTARPTQCAADTMSTRASFSYHKSTQELTREKRNDLAIRNFNNLLRKHHDMNLITSHESQRREEVCAGDEFAQAGLYICSAHFAHSQPILTHSKDILNGTWISNQMEFFQKQSFLSENSSQSSHSHEGGPKTIHCCRSHIIRGFHILKPLTDAPMDSTGSE